MPTPTPEETEATREVLALQSFTATEALIIGATDAQWLAQLSDNELWLTERDNFIAIKDGLLGSQIDPEASRRVIRNRSRFRFGLEAVGGDGTEYAATSAGRLSGTTGLWF